MTGRRVLDALLLCLAVLLGCSALIDPRNPEPYCEQYDAEARVCPEGLSCVEGRCVRSCGVEICMNNTDDDCDGKIDEADPLGRDTCGDKIDNDCDGIVDEGSDVDMDGYSWCGDTAAPDGRTSSVDCDDRLASVHPGLPETCDGQDNDCDGTVDEDNDGMRLCATGFICSGRCVPLTCANDGQRLECAANERCDITTGKCVSRSCGTDSCSDSEYCDTVINTCRPRQPMQNGSPCGADSDCVSGSCIDAAALRFASIARVCGQACCDDRGCPAGQRCFASGSGARSCLPNNMVPNSTPSECVTDDACSALHLCGLDRTQSFGPPTFNARSGVITPNCVLSVPSTPVGQSCVSYAQCSTRVCVPGQAFGTVCSNPCGNSADCQSLNESVGGLGAYCRYLDVTLDTSPTDYAAVCVVRRPIETGIGAYGASCATGAECIEGGCVGATATRRGVCSPTCCRDSQCATRAGGSAGLCRPYAFGDRYEMRCGI